MLEMGSKLGVISVVLGLGVLGLCTFELVSAEETCSWKADGTKVCEEDDLGGHNVWKDPSIPLDEGESNKKPLTSQQLNELELEIFVQFFSFLEDWNPNSDTLAKYRPEKVVAAVLDTFNVFDANDDGILEYDEVEAVLTQRKLHEDLTKIAEIFQDSEDDGKITLFQYLGFFRKLGDGKDTVPLLSPFDKLKGMPATNAKKIMQGSVQMFLDSDEDQDGRLNREELGVGMKRSQEKRGLENVGISDEHLETLFNLIDADKNELLTYEEFQRTIPEPPKSMEESVTKLFAEADSNFDNLISEVEFETHMKARAANLNIRIPTDEEVMEGFQKLDVNEDGTLTIEEMKGIFGELKTVQEQRMQEAFREFDTNADGVLSVDELQVIINGIRENTGQEIDMNVFLSMLDRNRDGDVSFEEMKALLSQMLSMK